MMTGEQESKAVGRQVVSFESAGRQRRFTVQAPADADGPLPVVVILHGAGASGSLSLDRNGWAEKAKQEKFLAIAPDGLPAAPELPMSFNKNPRVWNTGQLKPDSTRARIDDVAFLNDVLDQVSRRWSVDENRISVVGHSNGAGMAFRWATETPERIASLSVVASHCWIRDPQPRRGVPTLFLVGTADPIVPMAGGRVAMPWGGEQDKPAVAITLLTWAQAIGARTEATTLSDAGGVRVDYYEPRPGGAPLTAYFLEGHGHAWPGAKDDAREPLPERFLGPVQSPVNATDIIWGFARRWNRSAT